MAAKNLDGSIVEDENTSKQNKAEHSPLQGFNSVLFEWVFSESVLYFDSKQLLTTLLVGKSLQILSKKANRTRNITIPRGIV